MEAKENFSGEVFRAWMEALMVLVALLGIVLGRMSIQTSSFGSDRRGLNAALNAETTRFISYAEMFRHYRVYTDFVVNQALDEQFGPLEIEAEAKNNAASASINQLFFPDRYLNRDGSYNAQRELGEAWAEAAQFTDLDSESHFNLADNNRVLSVRMKLLYIPLMLSLFCFKFAGMLYHERKTYKWTSAVLGGVFWLITLVGMIMVLG